MCRATLMLLTLLPLAVLAAPPPVPSPTRIDAEARRLMQAAHARGMALAVIDDGKVVHVAAYGERNAAGEPLRTDTVMYAASLTKMAFGHLVAQLAQDGVIDLDASIATALDVPLPDYPPEPKKYADYSVLASDARWRRLTPRKLLNHASGFANFGFLEPDGRLKFHFEPGSRYGYSGEGLILLQFVIERGRLGEDVGALMQQRVFDRFGMARTSMSWRADFAGNLADGWTVEGNKSRTINAAVCGRQDRWIPPSPTWPTSPPVMCAAMGCLRQCAGNWCGRSCRSPPPASSQRCSRSCPLRSSTGIWPRAWAW